MKKVLNSFSPGCFNGPVSVVPVHVVYRKYQLGQDVVHLCCKGPPSLKAQCSTILDEDEAEVVDEDEKEEDDVSRLEAENCEVGVVQAQVGLVHDVINTEPIPSLAERKSLTVLVPML
jgi:hypothetical protein